jgi:hypothetical protein
MAPPTSKTALYLLAIGLGASRYGEGQTARGMTRFLKGCGWCWRWIWGGQGGTTLEERYMRMSVTGAAGTGGLHALTSVHILEGAGRLDDLAREDDGVHDQLKV